MAWINLLSVKKSKGTLSSRLSQEPAFLLAALTTDTIVKHRYVKATNASIRDRLQTGVCELCGKQIDVPLEVHIVSKLKDLKDDEPWKVVMKSKRRKTLVVCPECHKHIHVE